MASHAAHRHQATPSDQGLRSQPVRQTQTLNTKDALTTDERQLLELLTAEPGRVLRHHDIYTALWGSHSADASSSLDEIERRQRLQLLVSHLRRKVEADPHCPQLVQTVSGVGYRFSSSEER